jgi:hypothetical protein
MDSFGLLALVAEEAAVGRRMIRAEWRRTSLRMALHARLLRFFLTGYGIKLLMDFIMGQVGGCFFRSAHQDEYYYCANPQEYQIDERFFPNTFFCHVATL